MSSHRSLAGGLATAALVALAVPLYATAGNVPEIDGASMVTGLGLVSGAVLILRARFRSKSR